MAFRLTSEAQRITEYHDIHGIVVDWGLDNGHATIVFMNDGSASTYWSSGGGVIGAGDHANVVKAGMRVLEEAGRVRSNFVPSSVIELPPAKHMRFTLLTDSGNLSVAQSDEALSSRTSPLSDLGNFVQDLIFQIRQASGG